MQHWLTWQVSVLSIQSAALFPYDKMQPEGVQGELVLCSVVYSIQRGGGGGGLPYWIPGG